MAPDSAAPMCRECGSTAPEPHRCAVGSPRYAMDADLTLYWPWVRPCWEEAHVSLFDVKPLPCLSTVTRGNARSRTSRPGRDTPHTRLRPASRRTLGR